MATERSEYVKCVATGAAGSVVSWCGRRLYPHEWAFTDASHAALNARNEGRLLSCPDCVGAIVTTLQAHTPEEKENHG